MVCSAGKQFESVGNGYISMITKSSAFFYVLDRLSIVVLKLPRSEQSVVWNVLSVWDIIIKALSKITDLI